MERSPWTLLDREDWAPLAASTPMTLSHEELLRLRGRGDGVDLEEVRTVYLPLSRLLNLYVAAVQRLHAATTTFLGDDGGKVPFVLGIAGSVAVGKSTTARLLRALLARWPDHPRVALVTTDGFLHPNHELARRGLMQRKGFPESYDVAALLRFVAAVKAGAPEVVAPVYDHLVYDVVPGERQVVRSPDVLIVEGLNVLQSGSSQHQFVSDYFDFSIYVDADVEHIRRWYVDRFMSLRDTAFRDDRSYFRRFADLPQREARVEAERIWREINERNLVDNIEPTRSRADLVLHKGEDHRVEQVRLRKL